MKSSPYLRQAALVLTLLLAAWLRFYRLEYQSYWNDEGNSRAMVEKSVRDVMLSAAADIHPPGYYLAVRAWGAVAGESELALRGFSAFAGIVLVALLYRLGREYFDEPTGLAAALLGAVNPFLIYYSQEARMYELVATLGAASFLLFSMWLRATRPGPHTRPFSPRDVPRQGKGAAIPASVRAGERARAGVGAATGYCLVSALGLYAHYAFPFVILAENLAALGGLLFHRRGEWQKRLAMWFGLQAVTLALFLPWLPTAYRQLTSWPGAREFHSALDSLAGLTRFLAYGRTVGTNDVILGLVAAGLLLVLGLWKGGQTVTPLLWLLVPAGLTVAFGLLSETFSKFLLVAVPPLCLLLGNSLGVWRKVQGARLKLPTVGIWVLGVGFFGYSTYLSLNNLYFNPVYFRDDYRGIAQTIDAAARPDDAIITISPNQVETFAYYHRSGAPIYPLPHSRPLDRAETAAALEEIAARHDRIFVLYWGDQQADPEHFVEDWLNTHTFKAVDQWYGQVRLATYAVPRTVSGMATPVGAQFGGHVTLVGYTLASATLSPGDILQVTLFWQTDAQLEERYKVFVHLYAALDEPPVAQQDGEPGGGLVLTTIWEPGREYSDNHGVLVPPDLPPGEYRLRVGLYNIVDASRLPITLNGAAVGDRLDLGMVIVK